MIGAGALAPHLIRAHARGAADQARDALEPDALARRLDRRSRCHAAGIEPRSPTIWKRRCATADIVSCATLSREPLIRGAWLKKGAHVDLVGAFTPKMREADDEAVRRARVYVDARASAPKGSGDIAIPLKKKVIDAEGHPGRPVRALPRQGEGPQAQGRDHAVQVDRQRHRGPGGGDAGVAADAGLQAGWNAGRKAR